MCVCAACTPAPEALPLALTCPCPRRRLQQARGRGRAQGAACVAAHGYESHLVRHCCACCFIECLYLDRAARVHVLRFGVRSPPGAAPAHMLLAPPAQAATGDGARGAAVPVGGLQPPRCASAGRAGGPRQPACWRPVLAVLAALRAICTWHLMRFSFDVLALFAAEHGDYFLATFDARPSSQPHLPNETASLRTLWRCVLRGRAIRQRLWLSLPSWG